MNTRTKSTTPAPKALAATLFAMALAGCGGPDEPATNQDLGYEEPAGDVDVYRPESDASELYEEDVDVGAVDPDLGAAEGSATTETSDFAALDTNSDGTIAEDEWIPEAVGDTAYSEADSDGDGAVNREEFQQVADKATGGQLSTTEFAALDTDSDGALAEDEWDAEALANTRFAEADQNGDGSVDRDEFRQITPEDSGQQSMTEFAALDTNGDDNLGEDEWQAEAVGDTSFSDADQNGDQVVNRQEFRNAVGSRGM